MTKGLLAAVLLGAGLGLVVFGFVRSARRRRHELSEILDLPFGAVGPEPETSAESTTRFDMGRAGELLGQLDTSGELASTLDRARIPLRPGEYILATIVGAVVIGAALFAVSGQFVYGFFGPVLAALTASSLPKRRIARRRKALEAQLPDAIFLVASSLTAGHTFLRAIQMMTEEADAPISEEFGRVLAETQLGGPLLDALDRMALRLELRDLSWVVQAIRIQQTVGGKLADLLYTLGDFIRAREEVRREINVLTAEGRLSAIILSILPVFLLVAVQVVDPGYLKPLYRGWGYAWLGAAAASVAVGVATIFRMVKIEI